MVELLNADGPPGGPAGSSAQRCGDWAVAKETVTPRHRDERAAGAAALMVDVRKHWAAPLDDALLGRWQPMVVRRLAEQPCEEACDQPQLCGDADTRCEPGYTLRMVNTPTPSASGSAKSDYDSPWKEALERFFPEFLALLFPRVHAGIDWAKEIQFLDKEFQQIVREAKTTRRYADKLVGVTLRDGTAAWVLIHVEVQGEPEAAFAERMYTYHYKIRDRYQVPVASLAVLADTDHGFRPQHYSAALWDCRVDFRFPMVKLLDDDEPERWAELEASDNVFALVVMAQIRAKVTDDGETLKGWKFRLIRLMYERGYERALILELFRLIDWMIRLPAGLEADFRQELYAYEEQQRMPYVTTVEQAGIEKGLKQGVKQGLKQGVKQGEAMMLLALLQEKFGPDTADAYRERITAAEPEQLLQWSIRILSAETPETIFH